MWSTSKRDHCMRLILLITNCAACIAIIYVYIKHASKEGKQKVTSQKLIRSANMLLRNINENVDPCDDFGSFLCSRFKAEFDPDENADMVSETRKLLRTKLKDILDNIEAEPGSASAKMKTVYDSCVDYGSSELQGTKELKSLLCDVGILNWPNFPDNFTFKGVRLPEILSNLKIFGSVDFIFLRTRPGNETHESSVLATFYGNWFNDTTNLNRELAVRMLKYFDLHEKDMDVVIEDYDLVKNSILKLSKDYEGCIDKICEEVKIDCGRQTDDDWHDFCETLRILNFDDQDYVSTIVIEKPEDIFFRELFSAFHSFSNRTLANFIALSLIKNFQEELNFYFRLSKLKQKDFEQEAFIRGYELDRWKYCVRWIAENMNLPLENEFFRQNLTRSATKELGNITFNMDTISNILPNDPYINKIYEKFLPTRKSFFQNVLRIKSFRLITPLFIDTMPVDGAALVMTIFDVQASVRSSYLNIHFGMLLPPFYVPGHLNLMNRVLLAETFGHEFGHIIDEAFGLAYETWNLTNIHQNRQCISDQFSRFKFEYLNENLNGSKYDEENIPDNIATAVIDKVIEKYSSLQDITLPGLPYSTTQLFYMSSIQMCAKSNLKRDLLYKNDADAHAPSEFRLLGMMQNSRGYSKAFHCPEGSFMNPKKKCALLDTKII